MPDLLEGRSVAMVALFYIVSAETMVLITGVVLALWLHKLVQHRFADWAELSGYALVFVLFPVFMYRRTSTTPDMETNLRRRGSLGPPLALPDALHRTLKARAAMAGMSLSDYLLTEIKEIAERPTLAELRERLRTRTAVPVSLDTAPLVREEREAR
jgi:hypothetical protein